MWLRLGELLAQAYVGYTVLFLWLGCLGIHAIVLLAAIFGNISRMAPRANALAELVYGGFHPVLYLLVFQPALFGGVTPGALAIVQWSALGIFWSTRLTLDAKTPLARAASGFATGVIAVTAVRDLGATLFFHSEHWDINLSALLVCLLVSPLYLVPLAFAVGRLATPESAMSWGRSGRYAAAGLGAALVVAIAAASWGPGDEATRELLRQHRQTIIEVSERARLDPKLVAAIIWVTHQEHTTPFRTALGDVALAAWRYDSNNHYQLSAAVDPSVGVAQIKSKTVMTAIWRRVGPRGVGNSKEFRDVDWRVVPMSYDGPLASGRPELSHVPLLGVPEKPRRESVIAALLDPASNIGLCAFILAMHAAEWQAANTQWSIRERPEILATLYNIGFERSVPKADPRPNEFGSKVREAMADPWIAENF